MVIFQSYVSLPEGNRENGILNSIMNWITSAISVDRDNASWGCNSCDVCGFIYVVWDICEFINGIYENDSWYISYLTYRGI